MMDSIVRLIARFPDRERIIRSLSGSRAGFQDLLKDRHDAHRALASRDTEGDPVRRSEAQRRLRHLDEQLIRLTQGYPLA